MMQRTKLTARGVGALTLVVLFSVLWVGPREEERRGVATHWANQGKGADWPVGFGLRGGGAQVRDSVLLSPSDGSAVASNVEGYTYYWNSYKQRWLIAPGACVTAYHQGEQCGSTVSDSRGWYNICVSACCQQGPLVEVEATYSGLSDYFVTNQACGRMLRHDFYMNGTQQFMPPGP